MREDGVAPERILAVGGGTHNLPWMQMVSDIAGITQLIPVQQIGASYGDAFLAGVGVGLFAGTSQISRWVEIGQAIEPDPERHRRYEDYYQIYRQLYADTAATMHRLSAVDRRSAV
jgi:xylulokinase